MDSAKLRFEIWESEPDGVLGIDLAHGPELLSVERTAAWWLWANEYHFPTTPDHPDTWVNVAEVTEPLLAEPVAWTVWPVSEVELAAYRSRRAEIGEEHS